MRTLDELKIALSQQHFVTAAVELTEDWHRAPNGKIEMPESDAVRIGSHAIDIVGYDNAQGNVTIRNSWGSTWGDNGYGYLPQAYFDKFQTEAWTVPLEPLKPSQQKGTRELEWGLPDVLSETPHVGVEVVDDANDERIGWAFLVERQGFADIEELFVKPCYRGKGYGSELVRMIKERRTLTQSRLRLWVSHADAATANAGPVRRIADKLGLCVKPTRRRWAPFVGM